MWLWPKTTAAHSGNARRRRSSRPAPGPASWTMPIRAPPASTIRVSGSRRRTAASSTLPCTAATGGPSASSSSRNAALTTSPAWRISVAARRRATQSSGSRRAPRGRGVSEMTARRTPGAAYAAGMAATTATLPPGPSIAPRRQELAWVLRPEWLMERAAAERGDIFTLHLPIGPIVLVSDPAAIKEVFTGDPETLRAGEGNQPLEPVVGPESLLLLDGARHLRRRRLVLPPFHGDRLAAYERDMARLAADDVETWPLGEPFSLERRMRAITLAVIVRVVFGIEDEGRAAALRELIPRLLP